MLPVYDPSRYASRLKAHPYGIDVDQTSFLLAESVSSSRTSTSEDALDFVPKCSLTEEAAAELLASLHQAGVVKPTAAQLTKAPVKAGKRPKVPKVNPQSCLKILFVGHDCQHDLHSWREVLQHNLQALTVKLCSKLPLQSII